MITNIAIESFKSLERVEVELGRVNVFIGANGSGKSNLLEAIGVELVEVSKSTCITRRNDGVSISTGHERA